MKKFNNCFEMEMSVEFSDPDKAVAHFIEGKWKDSFWGIEDLEDLSSEIASNMYDYPEFYYDGSMLKTHEAFGCFIKQEDGSYLSETEEYGNITLTVHRKIQIVQTEEE